MTDKNRWYRWYYHFNRSAEDAERETPIEDFSHALLAATKAVASIAVGRKVPYTTVCPGWFDGTFFTGAKGSAPHYEPHEYRFMVGRELELEEDQEHRKDEAFGEATIRLFSWLALGNDPGEAPRPVVAHVLECSWAYFEAGGFGPEPEIYRPEDVHSPEHEEALEVFDSWYDEHRDAFWDLVESKAKDLIESYKPAISRVAVALCYHGTLAGSEVAKIMKVVEDTDRSAA